MSDELAPRAPGEDESDQIRTSLGVNMEEFMLRVPNLASRGLAYSVFLLLLAAVVWGHFSQVELIVTSEGALDPPNNGKAVHCPIQGQVAEVHVEEGDSVQAGQVLLRINSPPVRGILANLSRAERNLAAARDKANTIEPIKLAAMRKGLESARRRLATAAAVHSMNLLDMQAKARARAVALELKLAERKALQAQIGAAETDIRIAEVELEKSKSALRSKESLLAKGLISGEDVDGARNQVRLQSLRLLQNKQRLREQAARLEKAPLELKKLKVDGEAAQIGSERQARESLGELERLSGAIRQAEVQLASQTRASKDALKQARDEVTQMRDSIPAGLEVDELKRVVVRAPVAGTVTANLVKQSGQVFQTGQEMLRIAPSGDDPILRVPILNSKIAHIQVGQDVKIKYPAYPYQDYGIFKGTVTRIPPDAMGQAPRGRQPTYVVEVTPAKHTVLVKGDEVPLRLGLAAQVEIVTERRSLLSLFLKPFEALLKGDMTIEK